jgi:hypothetical protein
MVPKTWVKGFRWLNKCVFVEGLKSRCKQRTQGFLMWVLCRGSNLFNQALLHSKYIVMRKAYDYL